MSDLVPTADIERIVGIARHQQHHYGRAISAEQMVYVVHSKDCLDSGIDLRDCEFSTALDRGINPEAWVDQEDAPVRLGIYQGRLYPVRDGAE